MKIIYIFFCVFLLSCGARKTNTDNKTVNESSSLNLKDDKVINNNITIKDSSIIDEVCYEPIDPLKPMVIEGKSFLNTKVKSSKVKKNLVISDKSIKSESKSLINNSKSSTNNKVKSVERESSNYWGIIIMIIIILIYIFRKFLISKL